MNVCMYVYTEAVSPIRGQPSIKKDNLQGEEK